VRVDQTIVPVDLFPYVGGGPDHWTVSKPELSDGRSRSWVAAEKGGEQPDLKDAQLAAVLILKLCKQELVRCYSDTDKPDCFPKYVKSYHIGIAMAIVLDQEKKEEKEREEKEREEKEGPRKRRREEEEDEQKRGSPRAGDTGFHSLVQAYIRKVLGQLRTAYSTRPSDTSPLFPLHCDLYNPDGLSWTYEKQKMERVLSDIRQRLL
jgi:hypothetical protein